MKPVMNQLKRGFTLIELMIVVAIIGLLAALAIPNFIKFQARSRQAEARTNLKAVFTAQKSYYGDKQRYSDLLDQIGFAPEFNNRYSYYGGGGGSQTRNVLGAPVTANAASVDCATSLGTGVIAVDSFKWNGGAVPAWALVAPAGYATRTINAAANGGSGAPALAATGISNAVAGTCCPLGECEFLAAAQGNIDNDPTLDQWTVGSQGGIGNGGIACTNGAVGSVDKFAPGEPVNECNDVTY
jgi:type IV pilus assembly protein PilA